MDLSEIRNYLRLHSRFGDFQLLEFKEIHDLPENLLKRNISYLNDIIHENKRPEWFTLLNGEIELHCSKLEAINCAAQQIFDHATRILAIE